MKSESSVAEQVGGFAGEILGWVFNLSVLVGAYMAGFWFSTWLGLSSEHRPAIGVLSAIVFVWHYEHRLAQERWTKYINR